MTNQVSPDILRMLAQLPLNERQSIMRGTVAKQPTHPESWLQACIKRYHARQTAVPKLELPGPPCKTPRTGNTALAVNEPTLPVEPQSPNTRTTETPRQPEVVSTPTSGSSTRTGWLVSPKTSKDVIVPTWVQEMHSASGSKSAFMREVYKHLDPLRLQRFTELPPTTQYNIGMSVLFNPMAWGGVSEYVQQCMTVHSQLENPRAQAAGIAHLSRQTIPLVIVHVGAGIGDGHLVLHAAMSMMSKIRPDVTFSVVSIHCFNDDVSVQSLEQAVSTKMNINVDTRGSMQDVGRLLVEKREVWRGCRVLFLCRFAASAENTTEASRFAAALEPAPGARDMQKMAEAMAVLQQVIPREHIAFLADTGSATPPDGDELTDGILGKAFAVSTRYYGGAPMMRYLRSIPEALQLTHYHSAVDSSRMIQGWCWMGNYDHDEKQTATVQPSVPLSGRLAEYASTRVFDPDSLTPGQLSFLLSFRMQHQESLEKRLLGRGFWHEWSGWAGTPLEAAIDETFPCLNSIMATTGEAPPPNLKVAEACGKTRFCVCCETVLSKLAHAWRVPLMADVTIALLRKAVETWADGRDWE